MFLYIYLLHATHQNIFVLYEMVLTTDCVGFFVLLKLGFWMMIILS